MKKSIKEFGSKTIAKVERALSSKQKLLIGAALAVTLGVLFHVATRSTATITDNTVMITNIDGSNGGSGVIIGSSANESYVLTNAHVCAVLKHFNGGSIKTTRGQSHLAVSFQTSEKHDLCLVKVNADLQGKTKLASRTPALYSPATVSGHPNLLPNVVTHGHFSGNKLIRILVGYKSCDDIKAPSAAESFFCEIIGAIPLIKTYESTLVTATIMAGSSGSGIFTESGELAALAFAGSGELSYAFAVPYEFIFNFLHTEVPVLKEVNLSYIMDVNSLLADRNGRSVTFGSAEYEACQKNDDAEIIKICDIVKRDSAWRYERIF